MPLALTHADALRLEKSGTEIRHLTVIGAIPGVVPIVASARCGIGSGWMRSGGDAGGDGTVLSFKAPGSSVWGENVPTVDGGTYLLPDGEDRDKWLRCQVWADYMTPGPSQSRVMLGDRYNNAIGHDDVTAGEATAGDVADYTITMNNDGTVILSQIKAWIDPTDWGLEISDDGAAWVSPTTEATALEFPDMAPGGSDTLHLRRTITAGAKYDPQVLNVIHVSFCGL